MKAQASGHPIGSISHATMRPQDLIPVFLSALKDLTILKDPPVPIWWGGSASRHSGAHAKLVHEIESRMSVEGYFEPKEVDYFETTRVENDLEDLFDALDEYSAPGHYFGSHPGDGSDYGWWVDEDQNYED